MKLGVKKLAGFTIYSIYHVSDSEENRLSIDTYYFAEFTVLNEVILKQFEKFMHTQ